MRIFSFLVICFAVTIAANAQPLRTPAPSPTQTLKQDFALSSVELNYSRPAVKNRKVFGDLVPFGKVWRTGANSATTIKFGEEVMFGGTKVPAGTYGLLTIPGQNEWTIILTKQLDVTSPAAYKEDQDVARVKVQPNPLPFPVESFLITFDRVLPSSMDMILLWEQTSVTVPIKAEVDSKIMAQIDNAMSRDSRPYFPAAMYYLDNGKDLNKALTWFDKAIEQNPDGFWIYHYKASALAKLGKKQEAIASAQKSMQLAKQAKNDDYVKLNEDLISKLK